MCSYSLSGTASQSVYLIYTCWSQRRILMYARSASADMSKTAKGSSSSSIGLQFHFRFSDTWRLNISIVTYVSYGDEIPFLTIPTSSYSSCLAFRVMNNCIGPVLRTFYTHSPLKMYIVPNNEHIQSRTLNVKMETVNTYWGFV